MLDDVLMNIIQEQAPDDEVAILFSGGIDSLTCAFAAERLGKKIHCYTFYVDGEYTPDSTAAIKIAKQFDWPLTLIDVPVDNIKEDFLKLIHEYNCFKKTQVECTYPFLYIFPEIKERCVLSGVAADGHYGVSRKATQHYRHTQELFDEFRRDYFSAENPAGILQLRQLAEEYDKVLCAPYLEDSVFEWASNFSWREMNGPPQKAPVIESFSEFQKIKVRRHANLQLVSNIDKHFLKLLDNKELNVYNRKSIMHMVSDVYNMGATLF